MEKEQIIAEKLSEKVILALKKHIRDANMEPGDKLPSEREISQNFGVSRATVREAIKCMENEGIIETKRGKGTFVRSTTMNIEKIPVPTDNTKRELLEALRVRRALENLAIELAVESITEKQAKQLKEFGDQLKEKWERDELAPEVDLEFHKLLYQASGNSILNKIIKGFNDIFYEFWFDPLDQKGFAKKTMPMHKDLCKEITQGNTSNAKEVINEIIDIVAEDIINAEIKEDEG